MKTMTLAAKLEATLDKVVDELYEDENSPFDIIKDVELAREQAERLSKSHAELLAALEQAIDESGYRLSGPTDHRAAEDGEPKWVCNAREAIAKAKP